MSDHAISLLERMATEQERQTQVMQVIAERLGLLIQALAEDEPEDPDAAPRTYMDGSPCL